MSQCMPSFMNHIIHLLFIYEDLACCQGVQILSFLFAYTFRLIPANISEDQKVQCKKHKYLGVFQMWEGGATSALIILPLIDEHSPIEEHPPIFIHFLMTVLICEKQVHKSLQVLTNFQCSLITFY